MKVHKYFRISIFLVALLFCSFNAGASDLSRIDAEGAFTGKIDKIIGCDRRPGDRRYCEALILTLASGKKVEAPFYLYVEIVEEGKTIYSGPPENTSQAEISNRISKIVKEKLVVGARLKIKTGCGDEGCIIEYIEILEVPKKPAGKYL